MLPHGHGRPKIRTRTQHQRLHRGDGLAGLGKGGAGVEEHFAVLARPPVCVADTGDIRRERTVAAVVLLPGRGELHLRPGDPSRSATVSFAMEPLAVRP